MNVSLVILIVALVLVYMQSRKILRPATAALVTPSSATNMPSLGSLAVAIVGYVAILSFIPDQYALELTGLVALGALLYDYETMGNNDTINTLFNSSKTSSSSPNQSASVTPITPGAPPITTFPAG